MNDTLDLLEKIKSKNASWQDFEEFLKLKEKELEPFYELAQKITRAQFNNTLKIYNPSKRFPAISITGSNCALHCEHCNEKYLDGMIPIQSNEELKTFLLGLSEKRGTGALISGGCDSDGSVPLLNFLDTIKDIKKKTNLIFNAHTGLLNKETAIKLAEAGVDIISFDINLDEDIIHNIYHLDKNIDDYKRAIDFLKENNLNIVPHICVGLHYGNLHKELESIQFIKETIKDPSLIVIIALIPPKGREKEFKRPDPIDISKVIAMIRFLFPQTEISLGCMRPRKDIKVEIEKLSIKAGITRIEIPSTHTIKWLKGINPKIKLKFISACCAIPEKFEDFAKSEDKDIKRYLNI